MNYELERKFFYFYYWIKTIRYPELRKIIKTNIYYKKSDYEMNGSGHFIKVKYNSPIKIEEKIRKIDLMSDEEIINYKGKK